MGTAVLRVYLCIEFHESDSSEMYLGQKCKVFKLKVANNFHKKLHHRYLTGSCISLCSLIKSCIPSSK